MEEMRINDGGRVCKVYVLDDRMVCGSEDPRPLHGHSLAGRHPGNHHVSVAPGGGMSSLQSNPFDYESDVPQHIVVEGNAKVDVVLLIMPGTSCDLRMDIDLVGEGAEANIYGAYVCGGNERVKISVDMHHDLPYCNSRQLFKGMAGGTSRVDFYGKIIVAQDARKTEAYQENHNILLSDGAKVDTKPQLEIYADDVKCSHGATIGRLNEEEQFYMRSRGISEEDAKVLQMLSFIAPVLEHVDDESLRQSLASRIEESIRQII